MDCVNWTWSSDGRITISSSSVGNGRYRWKRRNFPQKHMNQVPCARLWVEESHLRYLLFCCHTQRIASTGSGQKVLKSKYSNSPSRSRHSQNATTKTSIRHDMILLAARYHPAFSKLIAVLKGRNRSRSFLMRILSKILFRPLSRTATSNWASRYSTMSIVPDH